MRSRHLPLLTTVLFLAATSSAASAKSSPPIGPSFVRKVHDQIYDIAPGGYNVALKGFKRISIQDATGSPSRRLVPTPLKRVFDGLKKKGLQPEFLYTKKLEGHQVYVFETPTMTADDIRSAFTRYNNRMTRIKPRWEWPKSWGM